MQEVRCGAGLTSVTHGVVHSLTCDAFVLAPGPCPPFCHTAAHRWQWIRLLRLACSSDPQRADLNVRRSYQSHRGAESSPSSSGRALHDDDTIGGDSASVSSASGHDEDSYAGVTLRSDDAPSAPAVNGGDGGAPVVDDEAPGASVPTTTGSPGGHQAALPSEAPPAASAPTVVWVEEASGPHQPPLLPPPYDRRVEDTVQQLLAASDPVRGSWLRPPTCANVMFRSLPRVTT